MAVCDIKGGSSSSLNKAQVFSAHCLISFCVWRIPYLFWGAGIVGADGIPVELFQILKDDAVKVLHSICQQIWKTQQWPRDWKRSVFIPIPK